MIIGAGVAGLWLMRRLAAQGRSVVVLESRKIGCGQTVASQGIIHGGTKYALTNRLTGASESIREMPARWSAALRGEGEIDLSGARVLADHQYLWSQRSLPSRMTTFFAASVMQTRVRALDRAHHPTLLAHEGFSGSVYRVEEMVLDAPSLLAELAAAPGAAVLRIDESQLKLESAAGHDSGDGVTVHFSDGAGRRAALRAGAVVCTAGAGNGALLAQSGSKPQAMQRRPLHMVLVRGPLEHRIYGHCLEAGSRPRLTISSHDWDGQAERRVWYLGGELAEQGVRRSRIEQIEWARREIASLLPWVDPARLEWDAFLIDRVEGAQAKRARPDEPVIVESPAALFAWPTKLAFAPLLADRLIARVNERVARTAAGELESLAHWPRPEVAQPPWKEQRQWHTFER